jgi:two-component system, OmpR family, alkaline phosphatase synthesis response regulator PhoP
MRQPHILLVDDEADIREVAALSLQALGGWRVSSAGGGSEAIAIAHTQRPDAILLDVMMPELDGPTTLERLRADPQTRRIPVIFLTAKAQSADQRGLARLGVSGVLTKPFDPVTLSDHITAILAREPMTP